MFFFLKLRTTTLATSMSRPGRIFGRPSRMVTWRTEVGEGAGELATDGAATDHGDAAGHVVEHQHLVAGHDRSRRLETGDGARHGAGGEHDVGAHGWSCVPSGAVHGDRAIGTERADAVEGW